MDFTDLIDWGKSGRFSCCNPLPLPTAVLQKTIRFIRVYSTWSIHHFKWDAFRAIQGAFHFLGQNLKNLSTVGNGSLLCTSHKTTDFLHIIVKTVNLTLHAQTEGVYQDNWQIPRWNEMLHMLKEAPVFAPCLVKESQYLMYCLTPAQGYILFVRWILPQFPCQQWEHWKIGLIHDMLTFHLGESIKISEQRGCMKCVRWNRWNQSFAGLVLEYLSS